jgi:hypothetical protein
VLDDVDLGGDGGSSWGLITSHHDDLDTGGSALGDGQVHTHSWRVVQRNETHEGEVVHGERSWNVFVVGWDLGLVKTP